MKSLLKITGLLLLTVLISCNKKSVHRRPYMTIAVSRDVTDSINVAPLLETYIKQFDLSNHQDDEVRFRYSRITDLILNPIYDIKLHNKDEVSLSGSCRRQKLILQFYDTVRKVINGNSEMFHSLKHSEIFRNLANELTTLSNDSAEIRQYYLYSNLDENSSILNIYDKSTSKLLETNPGEIEKVLESTRLLPASLQGITLIVIYKPLNRKDDERFNRLFQIYKALIEKRGGMIKAQANL